jgi:hypothetical protein
MTREDRLKQCKYYKGEKEFPKELGKKRFGFGFWLAENLFSRGESYRLQTAKEWAHTAGLYQYKAKWEGIVSDEMVLYLFDYLPKLNGYAPDSAQWFTERVLPVYIGSTSTS